MRASMRSVSGCRGNATAGLAVCAPFLLLAMVGVADISRAAYEALELQSAAHAGAQYGSYDPSNAKDPDRIVAACTAELSSTMAKKASFAVDRYCLCGESDSIDCDEEACPAGEPPAREFVRVQVQATFNPLFPYPALPETIALSRTVEMRVR